MVAYVQMDLEDVIVTSAKSGIGTDKILPVRLSPPRLNTLAMASIP